MALRKILSGVIAAVVAAASVAVTTMASPSAVAADSVTSDYALLYDGEFEVTTNYESNQIVVNAVEGDKITVTYELNTAGDYHQLSFKHAGDGWPALTSPEYTNEWNCVDVSAGGTFTFTLNAEDAANITANKLVVSGYSVTYTKVELNADKKTTDEPDTSDYALLFDGKFDVTTAYEANQIAVTAVEGDKITVTYELNDAGEYHQLSFKHAGDGWPALTSPQYTNEWNCVDVSADGTFTFTLNAEDAANITANKLVVSGYSVTYTKVELNADKKPSGDVPGYTGDIPANTTVKQNTAVVDGKYNTRFVQKVSEDDIKGASKIEFTLSNGSKTVKAVSTKYFSSLTVNGEKVSADDGYVFLSYTVKDIPEGVTVTCTNVEIIKE